MCDRLGQNFLPSLTCKSSVVIIDPCWWNVLKTGLSCIMHFAELTVDLNQFHHMTCIITRR